MVNRVFAALRNALGRAVGLGTVGPQWAMTSPPSGLFAGNTSTSGEAVDQDKALSLSAVFAGVRFLAQIISHLPLNVNRDSDGKKLPANSHPAWKVLKYRPNPYMTAQTFRFVMEWNRLMGRAAYAEIQWTGGGNVAALWPLAYWRVEPRVNEDGEFVFLVDSEREVAPVDMLYVPQITEDGLTPRGFLDYAVESLGLGISAQKCAGSFFANGGKPNGLLKHPGNPQEATRKEFRKSWGERHEGAANQNRVGVLWGGWEWQDINVMSAEQAQLLDSRKFSVEEVARWLNLPPHLVRQMDRATFSNIEHQGIDFVVYTLGPMLTAYEQEYDWKLLDPPNVYSKHNVNALLRGDMASRAAYLRQMFMVGKYSINELREMDDENGIGPEGDIRFVPVNMQPLEVAHHNAMNPDKTQGDPQGGGPNNDSPGDGVDGITGQDGSADPAMMNVARDAFARLQRVEVNAMNRAASKPGKFLDWLDEFYPKHERRLADALKSLGRADWVTAVAAEHCAKSRTELLNVAGNATPAQLAPAVSALAGQWMQTRPAADAEEFFAEVDDGGL